MPAHLSQTHHSNEPFYVNHYPNREDDYAVQIFLGSSYATLYTSADEARQLAEAILAALPAPVQS